MYFHDLIAHFFLALNNIVSVWMYHSLLIHSPTEGHLGCFQVLAVINKAAINLCAGFCVGIRFQLVWVNTKECSYWIVW